MAIPPGDRTRTEYAPSGPELGRGGVGGVTHCPREDVALKVLDDPMEPALLESCRGQWADGKALAPHLVTVRETCGDRAFVMDVFEGGTAREHMKRWFRRDAAGATPDLPPVGFLLDAGVAFCGCVEGVEAAGYLATDLKWENVFLREVVGRLVDLKLGDPDSVVKLAPVRLADGTTEVPRPSTNGSPDHLAPERFAKGDTLPFTKADSHWALAVCLYQLFYLGRHPAATTDRNAQSREFDEVMARRECPRWHAPQFLPKEPATYRVPDALNDLFRRTFLSRNPAARPTPADYRKALEDWRDGRAPKPRPAAAGGRLARHLLRLARRGARRGLNTARRQAGVTPAAAFVLAALATACWSQWDAIHAAVRAAVVPDPPPPAPEHRLTLPPKTWSKRYE